MIPSRHFTNAPWAPSRSASSYARGSVDAFLATANVQPQQVSVTITSAPAPTPAPAPAPVVEQPKPATFTPALSSCVGTTASSTSNAYSTTTRAVMAPSSSLSFEEQCVAPQATRDAIVTQPLEWQQ